MKLTTTLAALTLLAATTTAHAMTPTITHVNLGQPGVALPVRPIKVMPVNLGQPMTIASVASAAHPLPIKLPAAPLPGGTIGIAQKLDQISGLKGNPVATTSPTTSASTSASTTTSPSTSAATPKPAASAIATDETTIMDGQSIAKIGQAYGLTPSQVLALKGPDGLTNAQYLAQQHPGVTRDKNWPKQYLVFPGEKLHVPATTTPSATVTATIDPIATIPSAPLTTTIAPIPTPVLKLPALGD